MPAPDLERPPGRPGPRPEQPSGPGPEPAPPPAGPEAAILDPPGLPEDRGPAPSGRRRPWVVALAVVLVAAAVGLGTRGDDAEPVREREGPRAEAAAEEPLAIAGNRVEVPAGLRAALGDQDGSITLATMEDIPDLRSPLVRLWRLHPARGSLLPGPVVAPVRELRADPRPDSDRVAFVVSDGGLFLLDGFVGARPRWVAANVRAFDFLPDGSLIYASVIQRSARCCGGSEAVVRVGRTRADSPLRADRFTRPLRSLTLHGVAVSGTSAYVWGIQGGGHHLVELDLERRRRNERPLGDLRAVGVGPDGHLLVGLRDGIGHLRLARPDPDAAVPGLPRFLLRHLLGWSPDGTRLAAYGVWEGREALWTIRLGRSRPLHGTSAAGPPNAAAFLPGDRLVAWTEPGHLAIADVSGGSVYRIALPESFPEVLGAVAAG